MNDKKIGFTIGKFAIKLWEESLKELAAECLQVVVEQRNFDMQTLQIPKSGHYSGVRIKGKDVIKYNLDNVDIIQDFLY